MTTTDLLKRLGTRYCERCQKPSQGIAVNTILSMCENCWNDLHYKRLQALDISFCHQCQDAIRNRDLVHFFGGKQMFCDACLRAYLGRV